MNSTAYIAIPLLLILALLQSAVIARLPIAGLQLLLLMVIAWAILEGVREGLIWAFIAGICLDLFSLSPMGATSLAFMGAVLAIGLIQQNLPLNRVILPLLLAGLGTAVYFFIYLLLLTLLGYPVNWQATGITPIILLHLLLILPIYWLTAGFNRLLRPRRVEI